MDFYCKDENICKLDSNGKEVCYLECDNNEQACMYCKRLNDATEQERINKLNGKG